MKIKVGPARNARPKKKQWTGDAVRLDKAMADLEAFWCRFQRVEASGRMAVMPAFHRARLELEKSSLGAGYVVDRLAQLEKVCHAMAGSVGFFDFGDACAQVSGSVEVRLIRLELRCRRLIPDA